MGPHDLPPDRREKLLEAAIREFAEKGYGGASTNAIVREAGISKGLLFHYFGSKKDLFLAALDRCLEVQMDYFLRNV
ncbi:MAG: helix-turn-helix transcriptional regulator, partial [Clostridia bacterium]|nr:helix-turn-helix transcriptional regulator [Clostridia bacterium]